MDQTLRELYYQYDIVNTRLVETSLKGESQYEILESVIGQCSDGIYENSTYMEPYWQFAKVVLNPYNDQVEIRISNRYMMKSCMWNRTIWNPFKDKNDAAIKLWFAKKIKQIVNIEAKDNCVKIPFTLSNQLKLKYLGTWENTVAEAVAVYNELIK